MRTTILRSIVKTCIVAVLFVGLIVTLGFRIFRPKLPSYSLRPTTASLPTSVPTMQSQLSPTPSPPPTIRPLPAKVSIAVPFLVQAPHANWDALHEDACEEASLINVVYFLRNKPVQTRDDGELEIQALVKYETDHGYGLSITLQQLADIAQDYYRLNGHVVTNPTVKGIKRELASGHPVVIGAAGKILPNPFFKNGGPNYHMLVIKGYDDNGTVDLAKCRKIDATSCNGQGVFITNDVGIWQGDGFLYSYQGLLNAIHDWNALNILQGQKAYLVFES